VNAIVNRSQHQPKTAVAVAGQEEPIEPAYWKPVSASPISGQLATPSKPVGWKAPIVARGQRRDGMRYLYARGSVRQPITAIGTAGPDNGQAVWNSDFQPDLIGPTHDAGFYDQLYCAGYPGFNLGLSFKVPVSQKQATGGPGYANMRMRSSNFKVVSRNQIGIKGYSKQG
jgi:hypothetical protein